MRTEDARQDIAFLRDLVLRAGLGTGEQARHLLVWGLAWLAAFLLGAALPGSPLVAAVVAALVLAVAFGPWVGARLRGARGGPAADPGPAPRLLQAFNAMIAASGLLAYAVVAVVHAWAAVPVQDGGIWLLIVGTAYLAGSLLVRGVYGGLGAWLLLAGLAIPALLPAARAASVANAVLGGGGFLVAAALTYRAAAKVTPGAAAR